jgi:hypothetical protein
MSSSRRPAVTATSGRIAPTHIQNERTDEPCFPDQARGHHDGDDPAGTEGRIEVAHPVSAAMEHVLRVLDTEHAEGADRDPLGAEQGHEHGRLRVTSHGRERAAESGPVLSPCSDLGTGGATFLSGSTSAAPNAQPAAASANTAVSDQTARTTPASAGATSMLTLSIHPEATFVAVSSSGVRATAGANDDCVGRVIVNTIEGPRRRTYTISGRASAKSAIATAAQDSAWPA